MLTRKKHVGSVEQITLKARECMFIDSSPALRSSSVAQAHSQTA